MNPKLHLPALADMLRNQAGRSRKRARHGQALATSGEAVNLYRTLAAERPDIYGPGLAKALITYGMQLAIGANSEGGCAEFEEAIRLIRPFCEADSFHLNTLGTALNNAAAVHAQCGRLQEARTALREAVSAYAKLVDDVDDEESRHLLASSNANHAVILHKMGCIPGAARAAIEARVRYSDLAAKSREYLPALDHCHDLIEMIYGRTPISGSGIMTDLV